jgi:hypothetical protein
MTDNFVKQVEQVLAELMQQERRYSAFALAPRVAAAIEAAGPMRNVPLAALRGNGAEPSDSVGEQE